MKLLIDRFSKNIGTVVNFQEMIDPTLEIKVYEPDIPIEGFDLKRLASVFFKDGKFNELSLDISGKITVTNDFESAYLWADAYACFESVEFILSISLDKASATAKCEEIYKNLERAYNDGKKIYLGHRFDETFKTIVNEHSQVLNKVITKDDYNEILQYRDAFNSGINNQIVAVFGPTTGVGKMTGALKLRKELIAEGKNVAVLITEETGTLFFREEDGFYNFSRNFSNLTFDEEVIYYQGLIGKIIIEKNPDVIIVPSQGSFSISGSRNWSLNDDTKIKGVLPFIIEHFLCPDWCIIASSYDTVIAIEDMLKYLEASRIPIDTIYISPYSSNPLNKALAWGSVETFDGKAFNIRRPADYWDINRAVLGLAIKYPHIKIDCDYGNMGEDIKKLKLTEDFKKMRFSYLNEMMKIQLQSCALEHNHVKDIDEEILKKVKNYLKETDMEEGD